MIGTNKKDAAETAGTSSRTQRPASWPRVDGDLAELLEERGLPYVDYEGWQAIDAHECALGEPLGRPRVKLATWHELLGHGRRT